jgi:hypothetical protein
VGETKRRNKQAMRARLIEKGQRGSPWLDEAQAVQCARWYQSAVEEGDGTPGLERFSRAQHEIQSIRRGGMVGPFFVRSEMVERVRRWLLEARQEREDSITHYGPLLGGLEVPRV